MKKVPVKELTSDSFKIYGSYSDMINPRTPHLGTEPVEFYRDMEQLNLGQTSIASFSVTRVTRRAYVVQKMEFHNHSGEGILPLDGDVLIHVAPATRTGEGLMDKIEVFRVPKGTLVILRPGVWHHAPFAYECDYSNILVVLPERTYVNDCNVYIIPEEDKMEILLPSSSKCPSSTSG